MKIASPQQSTLNHQLAEMSLTEILAEIPKLSFAEQRNS